MENHHFEWDQLFLWAIFNSYVSTVSHYQMGAASTSGTGDLALRSEVSEHGWVYHDGWCSRVRLSPLCLSRSFAILLETIWLHGGWGLWRTAALVPLDCSCKRHCTSDLRIGPCVNTSSGGSSHTFSKRIAPAEVLAPAVLEEKALENQPKALQWRKSGHLGMIPLTNQDSRVRENRLRSWWNLPSDSWISLALNRWKTTGLRKFGEIQLVDFSVRFCVFSNYN